MCHGSAEWIGASSGIHRGQSLQSRQTTDQCYARASFDESTSLLLGRLGQAEWLPQLRMLPRRTIIEFEPTGLYAGLYRTHGRIPR